MDLLVVENVSLSFGGVKALDNISLRIRKGELMALVGPNGAGKTSLINCISGFYRHHTGRIIFEGRDISKLPPHSRVPLGIARTFQGIGVYPTLTVVENIMLGRHIRMKTNPLEDLMYIPALKDEVRNREAVEKIIDALDLHRYRKMPCGALPPGLQKRVALARALASEPKLLMLDEPMSGLSVEEKMDMARYIMDINEEWGITIMLVEHDMNVVADIAHRVVVMHEGKVIAQGVAAEVFNDPKVVMAYTGKQRWG